MSEMKAWRLYGNSDIRFEEIPVPKMNEGEILLRVRAAGICSSDLGRVYGAGAYHYPITIGHEFAGEIVAAANSENSSLIGKRAGVFPLLPCFKCESCLKKNYETCKSYSYIGSRRDGAFAEYVNVPVWNLLMLPDGVSDENAAMLEPTAVALHAARLAEITPEKEICVVGNGAIGKLTARFCEIFGAKEVTVLSRNDSDKPSDITIEAVGSSASLARSINITNPGGQLILLGNPPPDFSLSQKDYWQILRKQLTVKGSWNSSFRREKNDDWNTALSLIEDGSINPSEFISHKFPFENLNNALEMMHKRLEKFGKVMLIF
jgi:L-iditol 2-dehydrogenase